MVDNENELTRDSKVAIFLRGGNVQAVFTNLVDLKVVLFDFDNEPMLEDSNMHGFPIEVLPETPMTPLIS